MKNQLLEIRKILKNKSNFRVKASTGKFVPTVKKNYGVKLPILNELAKQFKDSGLELVKALWKSGIYEEQILAAKILGKICKKEPEQTLNFVKKYTKGISDWAVCDTLATQGIKKIARIKQKEIIDLSRKLISSKNLWQRRFALVLLINYKEDKKLKQQIEKIIKKIKSDKEPYVKKAVNWLEKEIRL
jgi:3-methyladenine DNA glycosylase AlkD